MTTERRGRRCRDPSTDRGSHALQHALSAASDGHMSILPVEATLPTTESDEPSAQTSREEIGKDVAGGAGPSANFLVITVLLGALLTNIACVNLAAQAVLLGKGVTPRRWLEKQNATRSRRINLAFWGGLLSLLAVLIVARLPVA